MVSKSKDGELIARVMDRFGFGSVRGSSSRAGRESAVQMIRLLRRGLVCGVTPDGPRGPAREVKEGVLFIARAARCPIVPITCAFKRRKLLRSWDRFVLPWPFNTAVILIGMPFHVTGEDDLPAAARELADVLNRMTAAADALAAQL
jgi:lysophospholipid acyltransferase (LPLAT)-like uncharacterized protein